ncbi:hypothetical protein Leryth_001868 [Lithospermum erythrorhizon]|nr:hypothetical protein Leryth_001868 [Lithospermum erythrorhizon]
MTTTFTSGMRIPTTAMRSTCTIVEFQSPIFTRNITLVDFETMIMSSISKGSNLQPLPKAKESSAAIGAIFVLYLLAVVPSPSYYFMIVVVNETIGEWWWLVMVMNVVMVGNEDR